MNTRLFLAVAAVCLLCWTLSSAAQVPITVSPDPVQFGTVPLHSPGSAYVYLSNSTVSAAAVSAISITGTDSADFTIPGPLCLGTISPGQYCEMYMNLTPSALGARSATLQISITGVTTPILVPLDGTGGNPIPIITSLSPASIYQNSGATTITINGSGFLSSSTVQLGYGSTNLPTTFVSATQLKATVPASDLTSSGSYALQVANPAPAGGSTTANFTIVGLDPIVQSVEPNFLVAGTASGPITLNGSNFQTGAKVLWNGTAIPTTYVNSGQLLAQPTTANLTSAAMVQLSVSNPAPGGLSTAINFNVTYPTTVTILDLPANDLVWDPFAQLIYASLPSSYGANGNSIAVINPTTGAVTAYHFAGSEPTKLALSADGKYLYVGLNGDGSVQRLVLPNFTLDINISLGTSNGVLTASDIKVSPTDSHTIAVALGTISCCSSEPLVFFTDSTKLANSVTSPTIGEVVFASGTTLYGYTNGTVSQVAVSSTGGTLSKQWAGLVYGNEIQYAAGLIYGGSGEVLNLATGLLTGTFDTAGNNCCSSTSLLPNSALNRAFVLGTTPFFSGLGITSYNLSQFTPIAAASLSALNGNPTNTFIPWGTSGLAFTIQDSVCCTTTSTQTVLLQSATLLLAVVHASKPIPAPLSLSRTSAVHGGWNFTVTIKGAGFVPGSVVTWNGKPLYAQYLSSTQLKLYVPWTKIVSAGTAQIVVENASPGGGKSAPLTFTIK